MALRSISFFTMFLWALEVYVTPGLLFPQTPKVDLQRQAMLSKYRSNLRNSGIFDNVTADCGILWVIATVEGKYTNFSKLGEFYSGIGKYRLLWVIHEVLVSAIRVKTALSDDSHLPANCRKIELVLMADRNIFSRELSPTYNLGVEAGCIFDRIVYFDELERFEEISRSAEWHERNMVVRLSARTNVAKLLALLSTPYQYTLYLDGDTAPCKAFQYNIFGKLQTYDVVASKNPFGYESTNGSKIYPAAPLHADFAEFPEINGGVIAYRFTEKVVQMLVRALELVPYFSSIGFDQDQAFMRHALFESIYLDQLLMNTEPMTRICRSGWNCDRNKCSAGCYIIHQRKCNSYGVPPIYSWSLDTSAGNGTKINSGSKASQTATAIFAGRQERSNQPQQCQNVSSPSISRRSDAYGAGYTKRYEKYKSKIYKLKSGT
jgi:hypothetical protein